MFLKKFKLDNFIKNNSYEARFDSIIYSISKNSTNIIISGAFSNYKIRNRNRLISITADNNLDEAFCINSSDNSKFSSIIYTSSVQLDDKIIVGGGFTNYAGVSGRNYLIRSNADGALDTAFCANAVDSGKFNNLVISTTIQSDGKILVGGAFTTYAGTANRNRLIRLNSDGTLDTAFCNNASDAGKIIGNINSVVVQQDGKILVGGSFTNYAGVSGRSYLIRLNSDGTLDTAFCNNASDSSKFNAVINYIVVQSDGKIIVGGNFLNYGGTTNRNRLIRLNSDGTLDTDFCVNAVDENKFTGIINAMCIQPDNKILIVGNFTNYSTVTDRNRLIRLNSDGTLDTAFCNNASDGNKFNAAILSIFQNSNKILVGGGFGTYAGVPRRNCLVQLNLDGTLDTDFCIKFVDSEPVQFSGGQIEDIKIQADKKVIIAGSFVDYKGVPSYTRLIRLYEDGEVDENFSFNIGSLNNSVFAVDIQSDGKILVGGAFTTYTAGSSLSQYLIRLNIDGTPDSIFCENASIIKFNASVRTIRTQSDGKILVGGDFTNYNGVSGRSYLVRLNADGTLDTAFCNNSVDGNKFSSSVTDIQVQSDSKIIISGGFSSYGGTTNRNRLIRLNSDGTLDVDFCVNASDGNKFSSIIYSSAIQSDGKILVGGNFLNYSTVTGRNRLVRLNSDGTVDASFCTNAVDGNKFSSLVYVIHIQSDGKIIIGGDFTTYAGTANRSKLIRLNSDGTLDTSFCINAVDGAKFSANIFAIQNDSNKIFIGGAFLRYPCAVRSLKLANYLIKLDNEGYAK